jgi:hypothetical protein
MTHKLQTTIEDFPEETLPEGKELSGISGLGSKVQSYLKSHPDFKLSKVQSIRDTQINVIENKIETPEEHQVALMQYIQKAKAQTETDLFKFEERLVNYVEEFYPKFCKVQLSPDQINDIRLEWNDYNRSRTNGLNMVEIPIVELEKQMQKHSHDDIILCEDCNGGLWNEIEKMDFYLIERIQNKSIVGTRNVSGKEITILFDNDFVAEESSRKCDMCHYFFVDKNYKQDAWVRIQLNPVISEQLPESLIAQKYLSSENFETCITGTKVLNKAKKLLSKGRPIQDALIEKGWTSDMIRELDLIPQSVIEDVDKKKLIYKQPLNIFSNGFGKDSITEIVLNHTFWDQIIFSDTGSEQKETYEFIEKFTSQLPKVTRHKIRIVHSRYGVIYDYYNDRPNPMTPSFTKRDCTEKFKIEPIKQWIKGKYGLNPMAFKGEETQDENGNIVSNPDYDPEVRGSKKVKYNHKIVMGLGINYAESWRKHDGNVWYIKNVFPLIEKKITKEDEPMLIKALGVDVPIKSGCFFCFFGNKNYWLKLRREHKDHYDLAVKFYQDAKEGSEKREDGGGMKMELVKFPTDEEFTEYMKKFPSCGDGEVALGCECMTGNMQSGMDRGRELPEEELSTKKPMAGF